MSDESSATEVSVVVSALSARSSYAISVSMGMVFEAAAAAAVAAAAVSARALLAARASAAASLKCQLTRLLAASLNFEGGSGRSCPIM